jgi:hypothetical protein
MEFGFVTDDEGKLLIEEYKSCRELIAKNIDIIEKTEVYAVGAWAAVFVFSLSSTVRAVAVASAWLPLVIAGLGFVRFYGLDDTIDKINNHFIALEKKFDSINWTTFYREQNKKKVLKKTRYGFWITLIILSVVFGSYMSCNAPLSSATAVSGAPTQSNVAPPRNSN